MAENINFILKREQAWPLMGGGGGGGENPSPLLGLYQLTVPADWGLVPESFTLFIAGTAYQQSSRGSEITVELWGPLCSQESAKSAVIMGRAVLGLYRQWLPSLNNSGNLEHSDSSIELVSSGVGAYFRNLSTGLLTLLGTVCIPCSVLILWGAFFGRWLSDCQCHGQCHQQ